MDLNIFWIIAATCILLIGWRVFIALRMDDRYTGKRAFFIKYIFAFYLLQAFLPVLRKADTTEERRLIITANILVALLYILIAGSIFFTWINH